MNYVKRIVFFSAILLGTGYIRAAKKKLQKTTLTLAYIQQNNQLLRQPLVYCAICNKSMAKFWFNGGHRQTKQHQLRLSKITEIWKIFHTSS